MITNIKLIDTGKERYKIESDSYILGRKWDNCADQINVTFPECEENSICVLIVTCFGNLVDNIIVENNEPFHITNTLSKHDNLRFGFCFLKEDDDEYIKNSEIKRFSFLPAQKPNDFVEVDPARQNYLNNLLLNGVYDVTMAGNVLSFYNVNGTVRKTIDLTNLSGLTAAKADRLTTSRKILLAGDINDAEQNFDGSDDVSFNIILKTQDIQPGTYTKLTVNSKGIVTAVANITAEDLPTIPSSKISGLGSAAALNAGALAGNVPLLDSNGKLNPSVLPALAISESFEVDSQASMLALIAQKGDIAIRSDENKSYVLSGDDPSVLSNWKWLRTPTDVVLSVNGKTGAVTLSTNDIQEGNNNLYYTEARATANFNTNFALKSVSNLSDGSSVLKNTDTFIFDGGNSGG